MKYSATSQEHLITDDSNQAMAYRAMPDATVRDRNPFLYTDPDNPYALPISVLPQGGIYQRTNYKMLGYDFRATGSWNHVFAEKHIVNLFAGTAKDAAKDGAQVLDPTTDKVKYDDGTTEEVYGFDVPVEGLDEEFDLAVLGTKGKWYDHKVSISDAKKVK